MPIIDQSSYKPPFPFRSKHLQTIYPSKTREVPGIEYQRRRIQTPDDDFIDLDIAGTGSDNAVLVLHGLGGHSQRAYVKGMIRAFQRIGWDGIAYNFRGCSGETNRQLRSYHSGATDDLETVVNFIRNSLHYKKLALVGFSLGGNMSLKYLGETCPDNPGRICCAVTVSVPCDLTDAVNQLDSRKNHVYRKRFLNILHQNVKDKMERMPQLINDDGFENIGTMRVYDNRYTAPINGFADADDYYTRCSSKPYIPRITVPTLLISAKDDPFLGSECHPYTEAEANPNFFLETPRHGGHVGFVAFNEDNEYWHETRAVSFVQSYVG
ncbi:MAG: alpha/beta fold hydrolase [bacterium]|nr:alpha/beta fold hydrolase [bacterium]